MKLKPLLFLGAVPAFATQVHADLYWKTSSAGSWTSSLWGTSAGGPYTSAYVSGSAVVFEDNGGVTLTITGATTNFSSITANENVTVSATGTLGTGGTVASITVANGKVLDFGTQAFSTAAGTGFVKNGDGTLVLAGGTYAGGFTLNAGTVRVGGVNALGSGGALVLNGGILSSNSTSARDLSGKYAGGITIGGNLTFGDVTNSGNLTFSNTVSLGSTTRTLDVAGSTTAIFNGVMGSTGSAGIIKTGTGNLEFGTSANNTIAGDSVIRAGNVFVRHANAFGTTGTVTLGDSSGSASATLRATGVNFSRPIILGTGTNGNLIINNLGAGAKPFYQGGVTGNNNLIIQSVIGGAGTSEVTFNTGAINHVGALTLNNTGTGTISTAIGSIFIDSAITSNVTGLTVSDATTGTKGLQRAVIGNTANAYTGDTTIASGARLELSASEVIPDGAGKGNVVLGGTLDLRGGSETINGLSGAGTITRSTSGTSVLTIGGNNASSTFDGVIGSGSGTVGLSKTGSGTLTLTNASTYTGNTSVASGGTLRLTTTSQALPSGSGKGNLTLDGTLDLQIPAQTLNGLSGSGTITRGTSGTSTLTVGGNNASSSFSGLLQNGSGTLALTKTGTGTFTLTGPNSHSGTTTIGSGAGVLAITHGSALGTGTIAISKNGTNSGTLELSNNISVSNNFTFASATGLGGGGSAHIRNVSGNNTLTGNLTLTATGGNGTNLESAAGLLTVTGVVSSTVADNSRTLTLGGAGDGEISGNIVNTSGFALALNKTGTGTWKLSGASNTFTGATTVSAGTLLVTGALGNTAVSISGGATLGGNGSIAGSVATASATSIVSPGTSPGTLTVGSLDLTNGAILDFDLGTHSDLLAVNGALTGGNNTLTFNFIDSGGLAVGVAYTLFTFDSQSGIDYSDLVANTLPSDLSLDASFGNGGWLISSNSLQVQFVPEPGAALLGSFGMLLLFRRRR